MENGTLTTPSPEVRETLMGFTSGETAAPGLSPAQRIHILGMCTDLNILHWTIAQTTNPGHPHPQIGDNKMIPRTTTYTFSQPLPNLEGAPALPTEGSPVHQNTTREATPPAPIP